VVFLFVYRTLLSNSIVATSKLEESNPQSPVWPNKVDSIVARKKPNKMAVKLPIVDLVKVNRKAQDSRSKTSKPFLSLIALN
jgi:hypothetical protein